MTPAGTNVRTRVHEYGGGAWCLVEAELVVFVDFADQRLYRQRLGAEPVAISPEPAASGALHYADMRPAPDGAGVVCVREAHGEGEAGERDRLAVARRLSRAAGAGRRPRLLLVPADQPRRRLARLDLLGPPEHALGRDRAVGGAAGRQRRGAAGRRRRRGVGLPARVGTGRAPPLRLRPRRLVEPLPRPRARRRAQRRGGGAGPADRGARPTSPIPSGCSAAPPTPSSASGAIACVRCAGGEERLFLLRPEGWQPADLGLPFTSFGYPVLSARGQRSPSPPPARRARRRSSSTTSSAARREIVRTSARSRSTRPTSRGRARSSSRPATARSPTASSTRRRTPSSKRPRDELPPLIVESHGGPTSHATPALSREFLYWTSRGIGVVDVNYRGSSGYGREYRNELRGTWGVVDTEDCVNAARYLRRAGRGRRRAPGDPRRLGGRLRDPLRAHLPRRLRRRGELLRRRRRRGARPRHPQVRVALPRSPDRALSRARRPLPRALADPPSSSGCARR